VIQSEANHIRDAVIITLQTAWQEAWSVAAFQHLMAPFMSGRPQILAQRVGQPLDTNAIRNAFDELKAVTAWNMLTSTLVWTLPNDNPRVQAIAAVLLTIPTAEETKPFDPVPKVTFGGVTVNASSKRHMSKVRGDGLCFTRAVCRVLLASGTTKVVQDEGIVPPRTWEEMVEMPFRTFIDTKHSAATPLDVAEIFLAIYMRGLGAILACTAAGYVTLTDNFWGVSAVGGLFATQLPLTTLSFQDALRIAGRYVEAPSRALLATMSAAIDSANPKLLQAAGVAYNGNPECAEYIDKLGCYTQARAFFATAALCPLPIIEVVQQQQDSWGINFDFAPGLLGSGQAWEIPVAMNSFDPKQRRTMDSTQQISDTTRSDTSFAQWLLDNLANDAAIVVAFSSEFGKGGHYDPLFRVNDEGLVTPRVPSILRATKVLGVPIQVPLLKFGDVNFESGFGPDRTLVVVDGKDADAYGTLAGSDGALNRYEAAEKELPRMASNPNPSLPNRTAFTMGSGGLAGSSGVVTAVQQATNLPSDDGPLFQIMNADHEVTVRQAYMRAFGAGF